MRTLITGGTVVTATEIMRAEVLIDDGTVVALYGGEGGGVADAMARTAIELGVDTTIDATGKYVLPGGVDVHTHMELPFGGTYASDTFESGRAQPPSAGPRPSSISPFRPSASR